LYIQRNPLVNLANEVNQTQTNITSTKKDFETESVLGRINNKRQKMSQFVGL